MYNRGLGFRVPMSRTIPHYMEIGKHSRPTKPSGRGSGVLGQAEIALIGRLVLAGVGRV